MRSALNFASKTNVSAAGSEGRHKFSLRLLEIDKKKAHSGPAVLYQLQISFIRYQFLSVREPALKYEAKA